MRDKTVRPTGECWCGCGAATSFGAFFASGHDKVGESAVVKVIYGSVPEFMLKHGFGPDGRNARKELDDYRKRGGDYL